MNTLATEKEKLLSQLHDDTYQQRLVDAYDVWDELVKPYLVGMKTGNEGEGNEAVAKLGLQDEIDRFFNFTYAKASKVRELLQGYETEVRCYFTAKQADKRSQGKRQHYQLDHGAVCITIQGMASRLAVAPASGPAETGPNGNAQQRDIPQRVSWLLS